MEGKRKEQESGDVNDRMIYRTDISVYY